MEVEITDEYIKRRYSLPLDLFKFGIRIESEEHATYFKEWIVKISEDHCFYFESNSFHRISLTELKIREHLIEGFMSYIETMKSIIINNGENDQSLLGIAQVSSTNFIFYDKNIERFINNYVNIPNPITKFSNKIDFVSLYGRDYSKRIKCLEVMKKVPLYAEYIEIYSSNEEELENITDPNLHNTQIKTLRLTLNNNFKISFKTIENLKAIYPNSITLSLETISKDEAKKKEFFENFTKILSKLDQTSLEMNFNGHVYDFNLEFRDVIFKVVEPKEECSYIRAKSVKIRCIPEEFCWIKLRYINISEFIKIKDHEEIKEVEKMFDNESCSDINKGIIIPMKYSKSIYITNYLFDNSEENQKAIEVMTHIKDIQYQWDIRSNYYLVDKYLPLLPARTKYTLYLTYLDLKKDPDFDEKLRMLNWNDKRIDEIVCTALSDENYSFVVFLLETHKVQECLNSIKLKIQNLTNCLRIMELLTNCKLIDSIELKYFTSDVDNKEEAIREAVQKLTKQVGLIYKIEITKEMQDLDENINKE